MTVDIAEADGLRMDGLEQNFTCEAVPGNMYVIPIFITIPNNLKLELSSHEHSDR